MPVLAIIAAATLFAAFGSHAQAECIGQSPCSDPAPAAPPEEPGTITVLAAKAVDGVQAERNAFYKKLRQNVGTEDLEPSTVEAFNHLAIKTYHDLKSRPNLDAKSAFKLTLDRLGTLDERMYEDLAYSWLSKLGLKWDQLESGLRTIDIPASAGAAYLVAKSDRRFRFSRELIHPGKDGRGLIVGTEGYVTGLKGTGQALGLNIGYATDPETAFQLKTSANLAGKDLPHRFAAGAAVKLQGISTEAVAFREKLPTPETPHRPSTSEIVSGTLPEYQRGIAAALTAPHLSVRGSLAQAEGDHGSTEGTLDARTSFRIGEADIVASAGAARTRVARPGESATRPAEVVNLSVGATEVFREQGLRFNANANAVIGTNCTNHVDAFASITSLDRDLTAALETHLNLETGSKSALITIGGSFDSIGDRARNYASGMGLQITDELKLLDEIRSEMKDLGPARMSNPKDEKARMLRIQLGWSQSNLKRYLAEFDATVRELQAKNIATAGYIDQDVLEKARKAIL